MAGSSTKSAILPRHELGRMFVGLLVAQEIRVGAEHRQSSGFQASFSSSRRRDGVTLGALKARAILVAGDDPDDPRLTESFVKFLGMDHVDPGASAYETRYRTQMINNLHRRAKTFGFVLQPLEPGAGAVSWESFSLRSWSDFTSTAARSRRPKILEASPSSCDFHAVI